MGLLLDGVHVVDYCLVVALGIGADGAKHALGLWDGSTENAAVCQSLLANLQSRGLRRLLKSGLVTSEYGEPVHGAAWVTAIRSSSVSSVSVATRSANRGRGSVDSCLPRAPEVGVGHHASCGPTGTPSCRDFECHDRVAKGRARLS